MEANLYRAVRAMVPSVKAVRVPGPVHLLRLDRAAAARPGQERHPRRAGRRPLHEARGGGRPRRGRLRRPAGRRGRIATRCQPDRDITIITHARGSDLDPSAQEDGYTAKWGVDATAKPSLAAYTPRHRVPARRLAARSDLKDYLACPSRTGGARQTHHALAGTREPCRPRDSPRFAREHAGARPPCWDGGALTWAELERRAGGVSRGAPRRARRRAPGDRIALALPNGWAFVVALLGGLEARRHRGAAQPAPHRGRAGRHPRAPRARRSWWTRSRRRGRDERPSAHAGRRPALILYTSGSTGRPRAPSSRTRRSRSPTARGRAR